TPTLRWQALSKTFAHLLGAAKKAWVGQPVFDWLHLEDVPAVAEAFTRARSAKSVQQVLCRVRIAEMPTAESNGKNARPSDTDELPPLTPDSFAYVQLKIWAKRDSSGAVRRFDCRLIDLTPLALPNEKTLRAARTELAKTKNRLSVVTQDLDRLKLS